MTNTAVYLAALEPGDTILSLSLAHGGHLSHGMKINISGRLYTIVHYGVEPDTFQVDYDKVLELAKEHRPKMIVCGGSAYPRTIETDRFRAIADEVDALLLCDMAHFAGLVAAGLQPNPVPNCDFVTSTTHKTLAGPRAGFILCTEEWAQKVDKAIFPGLQGGPLEHVIAAKATALQAGRDGRVPRVPGPRARERRRARREPRRGRPRRHHRRHRHAPPARRPPCDGVDRRATRRIASTKSASPSTRTRSPSTSGRPPSPRACVSARRPARCAASTPRTSARSAGSSATPSPPTPTSRRCAPARRRSATGTRSTRASAATAATSRSGASLCHVDHPLVEHKLSLLRERSTSTADFRRVVNELTALLTYEATKEFPTEQVEIETPLERTTVRRISGKKVAVVPVLRAGLGMLDGVLSLVSGARVGFVGLYRDEETLLPVEYYLKLPADLAARDAIVPRPDARDRQLRRAGDRRHEGGGRPLRHARLPRRGARGHRAARGGARGRPRSTAPPSTVR